MLSKSFKAGKCKTSLKLAIARIKLLKNKRDAQVKQMKRDLAHLLEAGQDQTARIRVEHVIREEKTMSAYDLVELYCELIVARLAIIESQKSCPIDLKEAISSVIFASPRCADIPELMDVRKHFVAKYGKEFITSALELRPDCGVNRLIVEKLSAKTPDIETKTKVLMAIAQEHNVKWDPKAFEEHIQKPPEDLLKGPSTFASKMPMESSNVQFPPPSSQKHDSATKPSEKDVTRLSASSNSFSSNTSTPTSSRPEQRATESRYEGGEFRQSYSREEDASLNQQKWTMKFKDATSAAQAAAESAERASMAARAAAEIASRGNDHRHSGGLHEPSMYSPRYEEPGNPMGSNLKGESIARDSMKMDNDEGESMCTVKSRMQNLPGDERMQDRSRRVSERLNEGYGSAKSRSVSSPSSGTPTYDDLSDATLQKSDGYAQKSFSKAEPMDHNFKGKKTENADAGQRSTDRKLSKSDSSHSSKSDFENDTIWDSLKHENNIYEHSAVSAGQGIDQSVHKGHTFNDDSPAIFDQGASDSEDHVEIGSFNKVYELDSYFPHQGTKSSKFSSNTDPWSPKQHSSGFHVKDSSTSQLHSLIEPHSTEFSETIRGDTLPSQPDASTWDVSDGISSESEDEMDNFTNSQGTESTSLRHKQNISIRSRPSLQPGHESSEIFLRNKKAGEVADRNSWSHVPSDGYGNNQKAEPNVTDEPNKTNSSSDFLHDQLSQRHIKSLRSTKDLETGLGPFNSQTGKDQQLHGLMKPSSKKDAETMDKLGRSSPPFTTIDFESNSSYESGHELNLGRLTGGLRNKGFLLPPYVRSPLVDESLPAKQPTNDTSPSTEKPTVSHLNTTSANFEVVKQELHNQKPHVKSHKDSGSRTPVSYFDSDSAEAELQPLHDPGSRGGSGYTSVASKQSAQDTSTINEKQAVYRTYKRPENNELPKQETFNRRPLMGAYKESSPETTTAYFDSNADEQPPQTVRSRLQRSAGVSIPSSKKPDDTISSLEKPTISHAYKISPSSETRDQKPHVKAYKESCSRTAVPYFDEDNDEDEVLQPRHTVGANVSNRGGRLSQRTKDLPSVSKVGQRSKFTGQSDVSDTSDLGSKPFQSSSYVSEPYFKPATQTANLQKNENSKFLQPKSSVEQCSTPLSEPEVLAEKESSKASENHPAQTVISASSEIPKPSTSNGGSTSRESSLKSSSHVHPKLPDYETLAAHFHSLRSNRR